MGSLIKDLSAEIAEITWTVAGKVKNIIRSSGSDYKNLTFDYDAMGNRVAKHIFNNDQTWVSSTFYIRDAQGNIMATYSNRIINKDMSFKRMEAMVYGSSRAGVCIDSLEMIKAVVPEEYFSHRMRFKQYELNNHLGNVLTVVTDCKIPVGDEYVYYYLADVVSSTDYFAFGQPLPERSFSGEGYKFGFNGKEKDDEVYGAGNEYDFGARIYDPRVGRWMSVDPLSRKNSGMSTYSSFANNPLLYIDSDGRDSIIVHRSRESSTYGKAKIYRITFSVVKNGVATAMEAPQMWMLANAEAEKKGDNGLNAKAYYKMQEGRMHPESTTDAWPDCREIRVTQFGIYIHPGTTVGDFNGCLGVTCIPPVISNNEVKIYGTGDKLYNQKSVIDFAKKQGYNGSLEKGVIGGIYQIWDMHKKANGGENGNLLTGEKFLLQPNSSAPPIQRMPVKKVTEISTTQ